MAVQAIFSLGTWAHVCAVTSISGLAVYCNGALVGSSTSTFLPSLVTRSNQFIAKPGINGYDYFDGSVAFIRIWNGYALTSGDAADLYALLSYCPAGRAGSAKACSACASGQYNGARGASMCTSCAAGTYVMSTGSSSCIACPAGFYGSSSGAADASLCASCSAGTYGATTAATSCTSCDSGSYSTATGASLSTTCSSCPTGTYAAIASSTSCTGCARGVFSGTGA